MDASPPPAWITPLFVAEGVALVALGVWLDAWWPVFGGVSAFAAAAWRVSFPAHEGRRAVQRKASPSADAEVRA